MIATLAIGGSLAHRSAAQVPALSQPEFSLQDPNGVDLLSANTYLHETDVSIGSQAHPLTHTWYSGPDGTWTWDYPQFVPLQSTAEMDSFAPGFISWPNGMGYCPMKSGQIYVKVLVGHTSETFSTGYAQNYCHTFTAVNKTGDTLVWASPPTGPLTYTLRDGTQVVLSNMPNSVTPLITEEIYPDGRVLLYNYNNLTLESITRSDGLELKYTWGTSFNGYANLTSVTAINTAYEYCAPTAATCTLKMSWPTAAYSYAAGPNGGLIMTVTDSAGAKTVYTMDSSGRTTGIQLPSSTGGANITYAYCDSGCTQYSSYPVGAYQNNYVLSVLRDSHLWQYNGAPAQGLSRNTGTTATYGFTSPAGSSEMVLQDIDEDINGTYDGGHLPGYDPFIQMTDEQGNVFYGPGALISQETKPESNEIQFFWNGSGDLTEETLVPKTGSALSSVNLLADYDWSGCNTLTCNKPDWLKDGNLNETDYTYDPNNGEVATVKLPPDAKGIRPQTNYTYIQQSARTLNSTGQYVASAQIWVRSTESYCVTSAAITDSTTGQVDCGNGDKVLKTFYYGPNSGPNNLYLRGEEVTAGGQSRVTCYGYDRFGNRISETTPNAALGLTSCDQFTAN